MAHKNKENKDCVSLDLFVGDEDDEPTTSQNVVETLCLRILSKSNIKYRFGGLQIHVKSPEFHIGKSFQVNLDENNRIDSIESYREPEDNYLFNRRRVSLLGSNNLSTMPARILITPKKIPETNLLTNDTINNSIINSTSINVTSNGTTSNNENKNNNLINNTVNMSNHLNQLISKHQIPILTADVVVEEILNDKSNQDNQTQSLGTTIVNTLLNKRSNHSNASSISNSPSQSIHSIHSLSSSMLELRSASPINSTSPEKLISKLTLQPFGHSESKYVKHKSKKFDYKKRSKEKLKNGDKPINDKNQDKNSMKDSKKSSDKNLNKNYDEHKIESKRETEDKILNENNEKTKNDHSNEILKKRTASEHNLIINEPNESKMMIKNTVETKSIGVWTHDSFNSSPNRVHGFFSNLRRTRSWRK